MTGLDDASLLYDYLQGGARASMAIDTLYRRYFGLFQSITRGMGFRAEEREDICQETFISILRGARQHIEKHAPPANLRGLFCKICGHRAVDYRRQNPPSRRERGADSGADPMDLFADLNTASPQDRTAFEQFIGVLMEGIEELRRTHPLSYRILSMKAREYSDQDIAREIGWQHQSVRTEIYSCRKKLKALLQARGLVLSDLRGL